MTSVELLAAYDSNLRGEAEMLRAQDVTAGGPLLRGRFGSYGFVTYRSLDGLVGADLDDLIDRTIAHFEDQTDLDVFEWKTRGHDLPPDLPDRLAAHGFLADEPETVMVGEAAAVAAATRVPDGVFVRRAGAGPHSLESDLVAVLDLQQQIFGHRIELDDVLRAIDRGGDDQQYWLASTADAVVATGRLSVVAGIGFAGLWGGCTDPRQRGRGLYRALVAARAQAAIDRGAQLVHSDCTALSRPILERAGLVAVTTTTPYLWHRDRRSNG